MQNIDFEYKYSKYRNKNLALQKFYQENSINIEDIDDLEGGVTAKKGIYAVFCNKHLFDLNNKQKYKTAEGGGMFKSDPNDFPSVREIRNFTGTNGYYVKTGTKDAIPATDSSWLLSMLKRIVPKSKILREMLYNHLKKINPTKYVNLDELKKLEEIKNPTFLLKQIDKYKIQPKISIDYKFDFPKTKPNEPSVLIQNIKNIATRINTTNNCKIDYVFVIDIGMLGKNKKLYEINLRSDDNAIYGINPLTKNNYEHKDMILYYALNSQNSRIAELVAKDEIKNPEIEKFAKESKEQEGGFINFNLEGGGMEYGLYTPFVILWDLLAICFMTLINICLFVLDVLCFNCNGTNKTIGFDDKTWGKHLEKMGQYAQT
jgi:hypothetical protein